MEEKKINRIEGDWAWGHSIDININGIAQVGIRIHDEMQNAPIISNLIVHEDYRRQGLATELLAICEKIIKDEYNAEFSFLYCRKGKDELLNWYKRKGYHILRYDSDDYHLIKLL